MSSSVDNDHMEVVSEVNTFLTPASAIKPILCGKNKVAKLTFSVPKDLVSSNDISSAQNNKQNGVGEVDKDGDLVLPRRTDDTTLVDLSLLVEYENSTSLDKVGLQVWRGAFLLADFVIHHQNKYFKDKRVLELGSGTGMTAVVAAMFAQHVTATDINDSAILKLLEINVKQHNSKLVRSSFDVKPLDFLERNWSKDLCDTVADADVILAADVVYHVNITTAFVHTLKKLLTTGNKEKDIFIAMEKRYVFTVADLDTVAPMYAHFLDELDNILHVYPGCLEKEMKGSSGASYKVTMQFVPIDFPQYFSYERNLQLILIHMKSRMG